MAPRIHAQRNCHPPDLYVPPLTGLRRHRFPSPIDTSEASPGTSEGLTINTRAVVTNCANGDPVVNAGADITGLVVERSDDGFRLTVLFGQSPVTSFNDFSNAARFGILSERGVQRAFMKEEHDGQTSQGEILGNTANGDAVDVQVGSDRVVLNFRQPTDDDPRFIIAQRFNTPVEQDDVNCDQLVIDFAQPQPPMTAPLFFTIDLPTNTWTTIVIGHGPRQTFDFEPRGRPLLPSVPGRLQRRRPCNTWLLRSERPHSCACHR